MKKMILLWAVYLVSVHCNGQDTYNNFYIKDGSIVWNKKYSFNKPFSELVLLLKASGELRNIDTSASKIFAELTPMDADYKGAGFKVMNTAIYISGGHINGFVMISMSDSLVDVSIKKIVIEQAYTANKPGDLLYSEKGERTNLEVYAINSKNQFKSNFKKDSKIFDYSFNKLFSAL